MANSTYQQFKDEWLAEVIEGTPSTIVLGNRFARKIFTYWLDFDDSSNEIIYCDGAGDGGIDIAYLQKGEEVEEGAPDGDIWYIVQSKHGKAFAGTTTLFEESQKIFETLTGNRPKLSSLSAELVARLQTFISTIGEKDKLVLLFATEDPLTQGQIRTLNDVKAMGQQRLGIYFDVEAVSVETIFNRTVEEVDDENRIQVSIKAHMIPSGSELMVGVIQLVDIYEFLKKYKAATGDLDLLYEKNVRKFLGNKRKVNKGIERTLLEYPERFGLYNNGITIVVEDFEKNTDEYLLTEPYVVNGCQTTRSIWGVMVKKIESGGNGYNQELENWKKRVGQGFVIVKIVKVGADGEGLLVETTRYTNSQNAVGEKDFIALESDFQKWSKLMANQYSVFLEIQRGAWESKKAYQKQNPQATPYFTAYANAFDLLKVYAAGWLCEPGVAFGKNPPFAPGGTIFEKIVGDANFGLEDLYAAHVLSNVGREYNFGRGATKQTRGQTRFLFFTVVIEILKDVLLTSLEDPNKVNLRNITKALLTLFEKNLLKEIADSAISVVDDYLTSGNEDSLFTEPTYNNDLNAYLKWDKLAKGDQFTPKLKMQIVFQKKLIRKNQLFSNIIQSLKGEQSNNSI